MTKINLRLLHNKASQTTVLTLSNYLKNGVMRKFISAVVYNTQPLSKKLLFTCFISGYLLATIIFGFFGPQVHHFMDQILQAI
jgi:hypothetical protein